jgi:hypothetical protein
MNRECINCENLPPGGIIREGNEEPRHSQEAVWDDAPYCTVCSDVDFGRIGCHWEASPIPFEEL